MMRIGGFQKFSLIDYPGKLASIIFTQGCNFRCRYCHNPELVVPERFCPSIPEERVIRFLDSRKEYLGGVVISGGEPTIQNDLIAFLDRIKRMGYLIKLDTNGSRPHVINKLIQLKLINYIAMDVKAPLDGYEKVVNARFPIENIKESIEIIMRSGIKYEFRTTIVRSLCSREDLDNIIALVKNAQKYTIQRAGIDKNVLDKKLLKEKQYSQDDFEHIIRYIEEERFAHN